MKVNFMQIFQDLDGKDITENEFIKNVDEFLQAAERAGIQATVDLLKFKNEFAEKTKRVLTLRLVVIQAMIVTSPEEQKKQPTSEVKVERFKIASKVSDANAGNPYVNLTPEEIVAIKKRIPEVYPTLVTGIALQMLEEPDLPPTMDSKGEEKAVDENHRHPGPQVDATER